MTLCLFCSSISDKKNKPSKSRAGLGLSQPRGIICTAKVRFFFYKQKIWMFFFLNVLFFFSKDKWNPTFSESPLMTIRLVWGLLICLFLSSGLFNRLQQGIMTNCYSRLKILDTYYPWCIPLHFAFLPKVHKIILPQMRRSNTENPVEA